MSLHHSGVSLMETHELKFDFETGVYRRSAIQRECGVIQTCEWDYVYDTCRPRYVNPDEFIAWSLHHKPVELTGATWSTAPHYIPPSLPWINDCWGRYG